MLAFFVITSALLIIIGVCAYQNWVGTSDSEGYRQNASGYLVHQVDHLLSVLGGLAFAFLVDAFSTDHDTSVVVVCLKGVAVVLISVVAILVLLRSQKTALRRIMAYGAVLVLILFSVTRQQDDESSPGVQKKPYICRLDSEKRQVCGGKRL